MKRILDDLIKRVKPRGYDQNHGAKNVNNF